MQPEKLTGVLQLFIIAPKLESTRYASTGEQQKHPNNTIFLDNKELNSQATTKPEGHFKGMLLSETRQSGEDSILDYSNYDGQETVLFKEERE